MENIETVNDVRMCRFPDCDRPAAWHARQAQRDSGSVAGKGDGRPVDSARQRASEIRSQVSGMIEHLVGQLRVLVQELGTVGDLDAAEA